MVAQTFKSRLSISILVLQIIYTLPQKFIHLVHFDPFQVLDRNELEPPSGAIKLVFAIKGSSLLF
jgi:hypothetical protein